MKNVRESFTMGDSCISPGERCKVALPIGRLYTHTEMAMPVEVLHGRREGPRLFLSAALHGDEINGVEIIRRVLQRLDVSRLTGTLVAVPIINVFGFVYQSRYLPDRRDLNRSFPGSARGSLASRLAHLFMTEIMERCSYGIDLHTAAPPRANLPQIRCNLENEELQRLAKAFAAPVVIHGKAPPGSLRGTANRRGLPVLLYEAGEPLRFNEDAIRVGVDGVLRVMAELGMIRRGRARRRTASVESRRTSWVRARQSGILHLNVKLGERVEKGQLLGSVADPFGDAVLDVEAPHDGLVIGQIVNPLVHRGDAIIHIATAEQSRAVDEHINEIQSENQSPALDQASSQLVNEAEQKIADSSNVVGE
ncbi:MAG: putative deacylase [Candidatus Latescibacterota bacterium]|jgi:predicted deacylase